MLLSGELCFHAETDLDSIIGTASEFQSFLLTDCNAASQSEHFNFQREKLSKLHYYCKRIHSDRTRHNEVSLKHSIDSSVRNQISSWEAERTRVLMELRKLQQVADTQLMSYIQEYFSIAKHELLSTRHNTDIDSLDCDINKRQAKVLRDIRVFAHHLYHETKGKVIVTALSQDSAQFRRCKKAIKENTSSKFMFESGYQKVKVRAVLKLENSLISNHLQHLATGIDNGKVKGLFCVVPNGGLHALCAYGLHSEYTLDSLSSEMGFDDLFQPPWFRTSQSAVSLIPDSSRDSHFQHTSYSAERLAKEGLQFMQQSGACINVANKKLSLFPFGRLCTLSCLHMLSKKQLAEGVFIALCRVLVSRIRTLNTVISADDVEDAIKAGFDSIYSTANEEYILLKPQFVLPEFVMLVYFSGPPLLSSNTSDSERALSKAWCPRPMISHQFNSAQKINLDKSTFYDSARFSVKPSQIDAASVGELLMNNTAIQNEMEKSSKDYGERSQSSSTEINHFDSLRGEEKFSSPLNARSILTEKQGIIKNIEETFKDLLIKNKVLVKNCFM